MLPPPPSHTAFFIVLHCITMFQSKMDCLCSGGPRKIKMGLRNSCHPVTWWCHSSTHYLCVCGDAGVNYCTARRIKYSTHYYAQYVILGNNCVTGLCIYHNFIVILECTFYLQIKFAVKQHVVPQTSRADRVS